MRRRRRGSGISPNQLGLKLGYGCTIDRSAEGREIIDVGRAQFSKTSSFYGAEGQLWIGGRSRGSSSLRRPRTRGLCAGLTRLPQLADNPEQTFAAIVTGATRSRKSIARAPTEGRTGHSRASSREGVKFSLIAKHGEIWHLVGGNCHAVYWAKDVQN